MLRYKTKTKPGLVALYDIRPGNGAGPFLQPRSPHGAFQKVIWDRCKWRFYLNSVHTHWIYGILLRHGMATLPQGNQELLVVREKVGRPPGELGVSKSMECDIFPSVLWHCWLGDRMGIRPVAKTGCWFVGDDDLTGALHDL